jgi:hypothetical protein
MKINRTTKLIIGILTVLLADLSYGLFSPAWASCRIENLSLEKAGKFTKLTVYTDNPFEFVHSTEEAKDDKPYRVIIDFKDAFFALPQHNFKEGLPAGTVQAIRTSQFKVEPEKIVRVVLDVKGPVVYKVLDTKDPKKVTIALLTAQDTDFPMWMANKTGQDAKPVTVPLEKKTSLAQTATKTTPAFDAKTYSRAVSYADTGESLAAGDQKLKVVETKKKTETTTSGQLTETGTSPIKTEKQAVVTAGKPTVVKHNVTRRRISRYSTPVGPAPETATIAQETATDQPQVIKDSEKLATAPSSQAKTEKTKEPSVSPSMSKRTLVQRPPIRRRINRSPTPLGPYMQETTLAEAAKETKTTQTENLKPEDVSTSTTAAIAQGIGKILGPESVVAKETPVVPESLLVAQERQQVELELVPQRKVVRYNSGTKRDPFMPLSQIKDMTFGSVPLPLFDNLKLVGVLQDEQGNRALLEDELGYGYILMSGDRIRNGFVVSVEDDKATFNIEEYGGYQIKVLELNKEY